MGDADFWELLTKHGIAPDSATAIVKSHGSMKDADLWERLVQNGAQPDAATSIVLSRGAASSPARSAGRGQPDPNEIARVQANVAKMRAANAPESDVLAYLQHEDSLSSAPAAPAASTDISMRNLARSAGNAATLGFADKFGAVDDDALKAFKKAHPIADLAAKIGGGALLPLIATLGAPALATLGGVVGTGAAVSGITAANESDGDLADRAKSAGIGTVTGAAGGLAGYAGGKLLGGTLGRLGTLFAPNRTATRATSAAARALIDDPAAVQARMDAVNALAPGGSSPATATISDALRSSQFLPRAAQVGESPTAARTAQAYLTSQRLALETGLARVGAQIEQHVAGQTVPAAPSVRAAVQKFSSAVGGKYEPAVSEVPGGPDTYSLADLRDALSQARALLRPQVRKEIEANGLKVRDLVAAKNALADVIYQHAPALEPLDNQYRLLADEMRMVKPVARAVAESRRNGPSSVSARLGIHVRPAAVALDALARMLPNNRAALATATTNMLLRPGADVASVLRAAPAAGRVAPALRTGLLGELPAAMRGLLFPADEPASLGTP